MSCMPSPLRSSGTGGLPADGDTPVSTIGCQPPLPSWYVIVVGCRHVDAPHSCTLLSRSRPVTGAVPYVSEYDLMGATAPTACIALRSSWYGSRTRLPARNPVGTSLAGRSEYSKSTR